MRTGHGFRFAAAVGVLVLVGAACSWAQERGGPGHAGAQPFETTITPASVHSLTRLWTAATGAGVFGSVTVAGGVAYVGADDGFVYGFDANGVTSCGGAPGQVTCAPLWMASVPGSPVYTTAAVANNVVYVAANGRLHAFDATGRTGCSGTPRVCSPLWRSTAGDLGSSPTVDAGSVFLGSATTLYAFDAAGTSGCGGTPKTCAPLWAANAPCSGGYCTPSVANGVVFANSNFDAELSAFDEKGEHGCSGIPRICTPLWTASTGQQSPVHWIVAVANGTALVSQAHTLLAFDSTGTVGCSGIPKRCVPLWTAPVSGLSSPPAIDRGVAVVTTDGGLAAFDAAGSTNCSGSPKTCMPIWTAQYSGYTAPSLANNVVFGASFAAGFPKIDAFDASGATACSGTPKVCLPRWQSTPVEATPAGVSIANGTVYVASTDGLVTAFR